MMHITIRSLRIQFASINLSVYTVKVIVSILLNLLCLNHLILLIVVAAGDYNIWSAVTIDLVADQL